MATCIIRESHNNNKYTVLFSGDAISTTVTADHTTVSNWISETLYIHEYMLRDVIVGLDAEWRPNYTRGGIQNPIATVQICIDRRCLIYQIIHADYIPQSLIDFLSNHQLTFVGVDVQSDLDKLVAQYGIGRHARAVDLRTLAADLLGLDELKRAGLKGLASFLLEKEMEKAEWVSRSRWDNLQLTDAQVQYACIDAFMSYKIGKYLKSSCLYNYKKYPDLIHLIRPRLDRLFSS